MEMKLNSEDTVWENRLFFFFVNFPKYLSEKCFSYILGAIEKSYNF